MDSLAAIAERDSSVSTAVELILHEVDRRIEFRPAHRPVKRPRETHGFRDIEPRMLDLELCGVRIDPNLRPLCIFVRGSRDGDEGDISDVGVAHLPDICKALVLKQRPIGVLRLELLLDFGTAGGGVVICMYILADKCAF
ncbi:uncharacterized protein PG998_012729 [Apiospora kogelbergensis]|uniref:Uncharacterized protein n=1 Tax=Apiospora kogelbergensis TaxID=1337665 RepID=A0AAW0QJ24_9PEZI